MALWRHLMNRTSNLLISGLDLLSSSEVWQIQNLIVHCLLINLQCCSGTQGNARVWRFCCHAFGGMHLAFPRRIRLWEGWVSSEGAVLWVERISTRTISSKCMRCWGEARVSTQFHRWVWGCSSASTIRIEICVHRLCLGVYGMLQFWVC